MELSQFTNDSTATTEIGGKCQLMANLEVKRKKSHKMSVVVFEFSGLGTSSHCFITVKKSGKFLISNRIFILCISIHPFIHGWMDGWADG